MSISSKTRKKLWAKSGNRCAICKIELFSKEEAGESLNIGEECHVISSKKNGPRHKHGLLDYDSYDNLLLLCRNHHKEIDTLIDSFPEELLGYMKTNHENWVRRTLGQSIDNNSESEPRFLSRIISGKELLSLICDSHAYRTDYDEASTDEENEYIGGVLQTLIDYGELSGMGIEQLEKIKIASSLSHLLQDIESKGYFLFAERSVENTQYQGVDVENWAIATLVLKKNDNPEIIKTSVDFS